MPAPRIRATGAIAANATSSGVDRLAMNAANLSMPSILELFGIPRSLRNRYGARGWAAPQAFSETIASVSIRATFTASRTRRIASGMFLVMRLTSVFAVGFSALEAELTAGFLAEDGLRA